MAIQWMDDFKSYGADASFMVNGIYAETTFPVLVEDPDPVLTGYVFGLGATAANAGLLRKVLPAAVTVAGVACRMWMTRLPGNNVMTPYPAQFRDGSNVVHVSIAVTTTGAIAVYRGLGGGTLLGQTAGPVLVANAWQHIETKVLISDTVGTVEVRVDGTVVLALAGLDTANSADVTCAQVSLGNKADGASDNVSTYFKDFIVWDNTGTTNANFLGSCSVVALIPTSDISLGWTPSTGATGWNLIDEAGPVDTDYVQAASPPPAASFFGLSDLPADVTSVKGLMTLVRSAKTDGGDATLKTSVVSGASTGAGTDRAITTAFTYWIDLFPQDPATAAAWLPAAVNAVQLKIDRTT
jgi:hypothetical protein